MNHSVKRRREALHQNHHHYYLNIRVEAANLSDWRIETFFARNGMLYFPPVLQLFPQSLRGLLPILMLGEVKLRHDGCEQFA